MSTGRTKTLGQRFGLLTGFGLILGGVAGWAWSLFQAPGTAAVEPTATPRAPVPSTPKEAVEAVVETIAEPVSQVLEGILPAVESADPEPASEPEDEVAAPADVDELPAAEPVGPADEDDDDEEPALDEVVVPEAVTPPVAKPTAVPDAVKAIRAAAAAARERLEAPAKALPESAPEVTEVG